MTAVVGLVRHVAADPAVACHTWFRFVGTWIVELDDIKIYDAGECWWSPWALGSYSLFIIIIIFF